MIVLETPRLNLRTWDEADITPFTQINQDKKVMAHFPGLCDRDKSAWLIGRFCQHYYEHGFTFYVLELKSTHEFIGFTGMMNVIFNAHFTPAVEIGWRLASSHWGQGYAPEAATAVLNQAFNDLYLNEVIAFTVPANKNSRRVMEKINMTYDPADDFLHPNIDPQHMLASHVLYRIKKP